MFGAITLAVTLIAFVRKRTPLVPWMKAILILAITFAAEAIIYLTYLH